MKIKLKGIEFEEYEGTTIDVEVDSVGDVLLPEYVRETTGRRYAFTDEYEVVNEKAIPGGYTVELQVKDLLELHDLLVTLPESALISATLKIN